MKPLPYEAILSFEEAIIREFFPRGVIQVGKGDRWEPAEKKADRTLARLLKDKKARIDKPRFPARSSSQNICFDPKTNRWVPGKPRADEDRGYTESPARALDWEPGLGPVDGVDDLTLARFTAEARERDAVRLSAELQRKELRSYMARLRQLAIDHYRVGGDPSPVFEAALRELQRKEAA